jgi:hypothetical protein
MLERQGNMFAHLGSMEVMGVLINLTTYGPHDQLIMGGGQALLAVQRWPNLDYQFGKQIASGVILPVVYRSDLTVVGFPTKFKPQEDSNLILIERAAQSLLEWADTTPFTKIALPRPGCGLGNLRWEQVEPVIRGYFDDRFTVWSF